MSGLACALAPAAPARLFSTRSSAAMRLGPLQAQARLAPPTAAGAVAAARRLRTQLGAPPALPGSSGCGAGSGRQQARRGRAPAATRAMVNVDVSPSVVLGVGLIGAGVSLWQIRRCAGLQCGLAWDSGRWSSPGRFECMPRMCHTTCEGCPLLGAAAAAAHPPLAPALPPTPPLPPCRQGQALDLQGLRRGGVLHQPAGGRHPHLPGGCRRRRARLGCRRSTGNSSRH